LRCKIDGYRAFDRIDLMRHLGCHWEEIGVEITEVQELSSSRDTVPIRLTKDSLLPENSDAVASGMNGLFEEGTKNV
jgi:hypothetical protein